MRGKVIYISAILILLLSVWFVLNSRKNQVAESSLLEKAQNAVGDTSTMNVKDSSEVESLSVELNSDDNLWRSGQSYEFEIAFDDIADPYPTAMTLVLSFDPKSIEVNEVDVGDLWTGANILEDKIDNENGKVRYSAGQDFDAEISNGKVLAVVSLTVLEDIESGPTVITLEPDSAVASEKDVRLIYLNGEPLSISVQ